jgi:hypothetical protein
LPGSLPLLASLAGTAAGAVLVGSPLAAGTFRYARNAAMRREPELFDLGWAFRSPALLGRSLALGALQAGIGLVLAGDCFFFATRGHPVVVALGAMFGYLLVFWLLMGLYTWPLLAEDASAGVLSLLRKAALLVLDNFLFTLGLALVLLLVTLVLWATVLGGLLLWGGTCAMLQTQATRALLRRYGVLGPDPTLDPVADEVEY